MVDDLDDGIGMEIEESVPNKKEVRGIYPSDDGIGYDLDAHKRTDSKEPDWKDTIADVFTQAGRGALRAFTWPADVLKLGIIGEGLTDIDDLENAFQKAGKPFSREDYVKSVFDMAQYVPTQDMAEKKLEDITGVSLEPRTELGKGAKQFSELASFTKGGPLKRLGAGVFGVGATTALKKAGISEGPAELLGDLASVSPSLLGKGAKSIPKAGITYAETAKKHALPFKEFMVREREPWLKGRLMKGTEQKLKEEFNTTATDALKKIVEDEIPITRLRNSGINLDALAEHAYETTENLARSKPQVIKTGQVVRNIDKEIGRIKALAPSPSDAQAEAIRLLERERDILKVSKPSSEQLINQYKNYNADMKQIYRKPEFSGKEDQVRRTYEFMKQELVQAIEKQGNADVANAFRASNKIYHEKSKMEQVERLLGKSFKEGIYNPKQLNKLLNSRQGKFLRRDLGDSGVKQLEEIAQYGKVAEEKMAKFLDLRSPSVFNEVKSWGQLAPMVFLPHTLTGGALALAKPFARHVQGKLITRPATRKVYKLTLKHAAEGSFNLLKKDFIHLERELNREWGSVDNFMDAALQELEFYDPENP